MSKCWRVVASTIAALTLAPSVAQAQADDAFELRGHGGLCVDVAGARSEDGSRVQLYGCNRTAAQRWTRPGDGTLRALGRCLDIAGGGTWNGTRVQLWSCNGTAAQQWRVTEDGTLINPQSGRCLDAVDFGSANGTPLQIWSCGSTPQANQRWEVPPAGGRIGGPDGTCVDVAGGAAADGARVQLWTCNGTSAQHWVRPGDGTLRALGGCLDVAGATGPRVQLWTCNGSDAQIWEPYHGNILINRATAMCLAVDGSTAGAALRVSRCVGGSGQSWWPLAWNPTSG